jgi:hypothetical protein
MLTDKKPQGCRPCADAEEAGKTSFRQRELQRLGIEGPQTIATLANVQAPHNLSIRLGPGSQFDIPEKWFRELTHITYYGAEPFLDEYFATAINSVVSSQHASHISLALTSDLSGDPAPFLKQLDSFQHVSIQLDIFDIGERLNFLFPENWDQLHQRLFHLQNLSKKHRVTIMVRLNVLNILYLQDILSHFRNEFPDFIIGTDTESAEKDFHIRNLPSKAKSDVGHALKFISASDFNFSDPRGVRPVLDALTGGEIGNSFSTSIQRFISKYRKDDGHFLATFKRLSPYYEVKL